MNPAGALAPFVAQDSWFAATSLVARLVLLVAAAWAVRGVGNQDAETRARWRDAAWLVGLGATFVGSLAMTALLVPFAVVALLVTARAWRGLALAAGVTALVIGVGGAVAGASAPAGTTTPQSASLRARPGGQRSDDDLSSDLESLSSLPMSAAPPAVFRAQIAAWRTRRNLWRARWVAVAWAKTESDPGEGYLELARLDRAIGEDGKAARALDKVIARSTSPALRAEAVSLRAAITGVPARVEDAGGAR